MFSIKRFPTSQLLWCAWFHHTDFDPRVALLGKKCSHCLCLISGQCKMGLLAFRTKIKADGIVFELRLLEPRDQLLLPILVACSYEVRRALRFARRRLALDTMTLHAQRLDRLLPSICSGGNPTHTNRRHSNY